jgi:hypothetical protein
MGSETFVNMKTYVKLHFGNNDAWSTPTDYYGVWVNKAYNRIATQGTFFGVSVRMPQLETSETKATVDGQAYVTTPTDALCVMDVYDTTNNVLLDNVTWHDYLENTDRATATYEGKPEEWVRSGSYIYLYPTPDAVYTMRIYYHKIPAAMVLDAATSELGNEWDEPIITLAAYIGKTWTMDYEGAKILRDEFKEQVTGIMGVYDAEEKSRNEHLYVDESYRDRSY